MDLERRIVVRDVILGGAVAAFAVVSLPTPATDLRVLAAAVAGALLTLVAAYLTEHTTRNGLLERVGPHVAAAVIFVLAQVAIVAGVAGVVPFDGLYAAVFASGLVLVVYRVVFGVLRPLPAPLLERERRAHDGG